MEDYRPHLVNTSQTHAVEEVQSRVFRVIGHALSGPEALQLAMVCSMRDPEDVLGFLFTTYTRRVAAANTAALALTPDEWRVIFATAAAPTSAAVAATTVTTSSRDEPIDALVKQSDFISSVSRLTHALRCTLAEAEPGKIYAHSRSRALCYAAVHLHAPDALLRDVLGTLVRGDERRLEELQCAVDDEGAEIMLLSNLIVALCARV